MPPIKSNCISCQSPLFQLCLYCTSAAREALLEHPPPPPPPPSNPSHPLAFPPFISIHQVSLGHASLLCSLQPSEEVGGGRKQRKRMRPLMIQKNKSGFFNVHTYISRHVHTPAVKQSIHKPLCGFESIINSTEVVHSDD